MTALLIAALASLGALLAFPTRARLASPRTAHLLGPVVVAACAGVLFVGLVSLRMAPVVVAVVIGSGVATVRTVRRRRNRVAASTRRRRVLEACEGLAGDVAAGQPPNVALRAMADDFPELRPIADAGDVGADVPGAFRAQAALPGAGMLTVAGAAWSVALGSGSGLAEALNLAAEDIRSEQATSKMVETELAAARATARLLAALPLGVLLLGRGMGGDPVHFLFAVPAGQACLVIGLGLAWLGSEWMERLADQVAGS